MKLTFEVKMMLLTAAAYCFGYGVWPMAFGEQTPAYWVWMPAFHLILFYLVYKFVSNSIAKRPAQFMAAFMGGTTVKMLLSVAVLAIFIYNNEAEKMKFGLSFMSLYVLFLILDVMELVKESAKSQEKASN